MLALSHFADGKVMEILVEIDGVLQAVLVDFLFEIAVPIKQSDSDEVDVEVAG